MPPVLLGVAAGIGAGVLGASLGASILVGLSVFHQARQAERARRQGRGQRATQTIRASVEPAKWRIGITRCFGMLSQIAWSGRQLQYTLVIGEAPIQSVTRVWVQGRGVDISATHGQSVTLSADQVRGEGGTDTAMEFQFFLSGVSTAPSGSDKRVSTPWDKADGLRWSSDMQMQGLAYAVVYVTQNKDGDWWRSIPEVEFRTTGYMWAPPGGTPAVITNAAQVRRWWEVVRERQPIDSIDATTYAAAVTTCTSAGYEVHGTIDADDDHESTRGALDFAMDGSVVDWNGGLRFLPGVARTKTLDIPMADILDLPIIRPSRDLHERINEVEMRLAQSRIADWQEHSMPPAVDAAAQTRDGGVLVRDYGVVEYITDPEVATRIMARQMLETQGLEVDLRLPYGTDAAPFRYLSLAPGDIVGVALPGLAGKRFRIDGTGPAGEDTLTLTLSEELPARYTAAGATVAAITATVPETATLDAVTGLAMMFEAQKATHEVFAGFTFTFSGGGGAVGKDGGSIPPATLSVTQAEGEETVETDRLVVVSWDKLDDADPALGFDIEFFEDRENVGSGGP